MRSYVSVTWLVEIVAFISGIDIGSRPRRRQCGRRPRDGAEASELQGGGADVAGVRRGGAMVGPVATGQAGGDAAGDRRARGRGSTRAGLGPAKGRRPEPHRRLRVPRL